MIWCRGFVIVGWELLLFNFSSFCAPSEEAGGLRIFFCFIVFVYF